MMKLLIDTNVIIDFFADRAPHAVSSEKVIRLCDKEYAEGFLTASSVTDIYYILRKVVGRAAALKNIGRLLDMLEVASVGKSEVCAAMALDMPDFEDALASVCAKHISADYIVTRNTKDFINSSVPAITPNTLLSYKAIEAELIRIEAEAGRVSYVTLEDFEKETEELLRKAEEEAES